MKGKVTSIEEVKHAAYWGTDQASATCEELGHFREDHFQDGKFISYPPLRTWCNVHNVSWVGDNGCWMCG